MVNKIGNSSMTLRTLYMYMFFTLVLLCQAVEIKLESNFSSSYVESNYVVKESEFVLECFS